MQPNLQVQPGETKESYRIRVREEMKKAEAARRDLLSTGKIPVVMDVDDFGFLLPGHDDLLRLRKTYPNFKITAFTIPIPKEFFNTTNAKQFTNEKYRKWAKIVNELEWLEIAIHGFTHIHNEMECSYEKANTTLMAIENFFGEMGLNYSKIFKAPYWQYSYDALVALRDRGYTVAIDRNHPRPIPEGLKTYLYNWSFEEPLPETRPLPESLGYEEIKGHGHFTGRNTNNIMDALPNILHYLPEQTHFMTIGEYLKKHEK